MKISTYLSSRMEPNNLGMAANLFWPDEVSTEQRFGHQRHHAYNVHIERCECWGRFHEELGLVLTQD